MKTVDWSVANNLGSFIATLDHDQDYAIEQYFNGESYWKEWINSIIEGNFTDFSAFPVSHANEEYREFLEFLDGNGYVVEYAPCIRIKRNDFEGD